MKSPLILLTCVAVVTTVQLRTVNADLFYVLPNVLSDPANPEVQVINCDLTHDGRPVRVALGDEVDLPVDSSSDCYHCGPCTEGGMECARQYGPCKGV